MTLQQKRLLREIETKQWARGERVIFPANENPLNNWTRHAYYNEGLQEFSAYDYPSSWDRDCAADVMAKRIWEDYHMYEEGMMAGFREVISLSSAGAERNN